MATNDLPLPDEVLEEAHHTSMFPNAFSISEDEESGNGGEDGAESADFKKPITTKAATDAAKKYVAMCQARRTLTNVLPLVCSYTWRIDLAKSEKYWVGWFSGLSDKFLNLRLPKQLLLASIDGLDRTLTVGQMQGRFQMQVLARCGHAVHEDRPHEVAEVISGYLIRNRFAEAAGEFRCHMPSC